MRGWETGTLEIHSASMEITDTNRLEAEPHRLRIITSEQTEQLAKKEADLSGKQLTWHMDERLRMPVYSRYQSSVIFEIGKAGGPLSALNIKKQPEAIAVLWMQDLTDDVEQEVKIPVIMGKDLDVLRQNIINDQTKKHHDFEVVGMLTARLKLDSGLDEDHEQLRLSQSRRHALEAYDHVEGEAEIAEKQAHFDDDGVIDKRERKELDKAHKRQLESRGRGPAQIKAYRTGKWMAKGIKERLPFGKDKTREPTIQTEA